MYQQNLAGATFPRNRNILRDSDHVTVWENVNLPAQRKRSVPTRTWGLKAREQFYVVFRTLHPELQVADKGKKKP